MRGNMMVIKELKSDGTLIQFEDRDIVAKNQIQETQEILSDFIIKHIMKGRKDVQ